MNLFQKLNRRKNPPSLTFFLILLIFVLDCFVLAADKFCTVQGSAEWETVINQAFQTLEKKDSKVKGDYLIQCYDPEIDALFEGGGWGGIWAQNQTGMFFWTPFFNNFFFRAQNNAFSYWFDHQADGKRLDSRGELPPAGAICETVLTKTKMIIDGKEQLVTLKDIKENNIQLPDDQDPFLLSHNYDGASPGVFWAGGTALAVVCKGDLLLISRDESDLQSYLPKIEKALSWLNNKVDPETGLIVGGAEQVSPFDGTYLISSININYAAALDITIRLELLAGKKEKALVYQKRLNLLKKALKRLQIDGRSFIKYEDRSGRRHGIFGADQFGYYESWPNINAICYRVVDDLTAKQIYQDIKAIPQLRPYATICTNYPGRDEPRWKEGSGLRAAGNWMNGGCWGPADARAMKAYLQVGAYNDALKLVKRVLQLQQSGQMPDHLDGWGKTSSRRGCNIDYFAVFGALLRGLFEYDYYADSLVLIPHLPAEIGSYQQLQAVRWGKKELFIEWKRTAEQTNITNVMVNSIKISNFKTDQVSLNYNQLPNKAQITILCE